MPRSVTKYKPWVEPDGLEQLRSWARAGLTNEEIADRIGVHASTLSRWGTAHPEIGEALQETKEVVDQRVVGSLNKRANGYMVEETKTTVTVAADGTKTQKVEKINKHIPADPTAMIFWLKNRQPADWRDRKDVALEGAIPVVISGAQELTD